MNYLVIIGVTIGASLVAVLFGAFFTFDQLVRLEYNSHRAHWEGNGTPRGIFWMPRQYWRSHSTGLPGIWKAQYRSLFAMWKASLVWLFSTPEWIRSDEKARQLIRRLRILALVWNGSVLVLIAVAIIGISS